MIRMQFDLKEPFRAILTPEQAREEFEKGGDNISYVLMSREELAQVLAHWTLMTP